MSGRNRFPFTASQWQELEHQALIFKYMVSGIPIPPDLLFTIKRTSLDSPFISRLFPHQYPDVGWNYLQMGTGRKIDPEPGRCRRTDGKKWRCSKEAYPDSKYCERHMHRGKNRSRKPVEVLKTTITTSSALNSNSSTPAISSITQNSTFSSSSHSLASSLSNSFPSDSHSFLYQQQHYSSSSRPPGSPHLLLDSHSYSHNNPDYRRNRPYFYGMKEDVDEHPFLSEEHSRNNMRNFSTSSMEDSWQLTPLTMSCSSSSSSKHRNNCSALLPEYSSYLQLTPQRFGDSPKQLQQEEHYYEMQRKMMERDEPQKTMHHFFDEWSPKDNRESWLDLDDKSSNNNNNGSVSSATQLSMSIPNSSQHDFSSIFSSNKHNQN